VPSVQVIDQDKFTSVTYPTALYSSKTEQEVPPPVSNAPHHVEAKHPHVALLITGSAAVDIIAQAQAGVDNCLMMHSTAPGYVSLSLGGVARNIAEAAYRVIASDSSELSSLLVSAVGNDPFGRFLITETSGIGMRVDGLVQTDKRTPVCNMILDGSGGLIGGVADMESTRTATLDKHAVGFLVLC
jgi:pseudouridylate synthase / pseudouridine kinase